MLCTVNWEAGSASCPARASRNPRFPNTALLSRVRRAAAAQSCFSPSPTPPSSGHGYIDIYTRLPQRPAAREWVWHTKPATLQNLHTWKKKKASAPPENSAATHTNIALVTWERGGHGGFLSHSNVSSYRRAINKPGGRAGGGALHTSSTGQGPGSRCSRGDPPRAREAPGSCQSCSGAAQAPRHREAQQHPGAAPVLKALIQDNVCVGAVVPLPEPCTRSPPPHRAGLALRLPATLVAGAGASQ